MGKIAGTVLAALLAGAPASAGERSLATGPCPAAEGEAVSVVAAIAADTVKLADGRVVRLAGIEPPRPPPGHDGPWPLADAARNTLGDLAAGPAVRLLLSETKADRYNRLHGDLLLADGRRFAAILVAAGLARIRVAAGETACFAELLAAERVARKAGRGLWLNPDYAVLTANDASLGERSGLYELVEGRVLSVGHGTRMIFLDFGRDYRRDFTVMLPSAVAARLAVPVETLVRRRIRVRGIVEESNGPAIRIDDPAAIELLDEDEGVGREG